MPAITTRRDGSPIAKPFAWSYSKLKNFENCPKKHFHVDLQKDFTEEKGEALTWGDQVHEAAAKRLKNKSPLPQGLELLEPWCARIEKGGGLILVEQKFAISTDFGACGYFEKGTRPAWFRGVADVLKLLPPVALAVDWKTGKILEDSVQLALMAQCVFAHHPEIHRIRTEFVWLKEDASTREDFAREDMPGLWRVLLPRVEALQNAWDNMNYPPKPSGLCRKYCPVTACPHHGIGAPRVPH